MTPSFVQARLDRWSRQRLAHDPLLVQRFSMLYEYLATLPRASRRWLSRRLARKLAMTLTAAALLLALSSVPVFADSITVAAGARGFNSGDGCSLVEAIVNANDNAMTYPECAAGDGASDTIYLPPAEVMTYAAYYGSNTYGSGTALVDITSTIIIEGNSSTIERDTSITDDFRLVYVAPYGNLTLNQATITGGSAEVGGGILVTSAPIGGGDYQDGTLTLNYSTVTGNYADDYAGGIANIGGMVTLNDSTVSYNRSDEYDGGIHNGGIVPEASQDPPVNGGTLTLNRSTVSHNYAYYYAGGIHNEHGTTTLNDSTVEYNSTSDCGCFGGPTGGGGIFSNPEAILNLNSTIVRENEALAGAGIVVGGQTTIRLSTISGNDAFIGGGILSLVQYFPDEFTTIEKSTITGNYAVFGGGLVNGFGTALVYQSAISGNTAIIAGGGVLSGYTAITLRAGSPDQKSPRRANRSDQKSAELSDRVAEAFPKLKSVPTPADLISGLRGAMRQHHKPGSPSANLQPENDGTPIITALINSTVSGNQADGGGGITNGSGEFYLVNSTVSDNYAYSFGGGIINYYAGTLQLSRSLISGNRSDDINEIANCPCDNTPGTVIADDYNLFGHDGETNEQAIYGFTPGVTDFNATSNGDGVSTPVPTPLTDILAPLGFNGGPTQTHALVADSPAIDKAPNADCEPPSPTNGVDQRNFLRNVDGDSNPTANDCDIGAYEYNSSTAVNVTGPTGKAGQQGNVVLKWRTTSEAQIAGFNVYRKLASKEEAGTGAWKKINKNLIQPKHPGASLGDKYRYKDSRAKKGKTYRYKIQVIYTDSRREWTKTVNVKTP